MKTTEPNQSSQIKS